MRSTQVVEAVTELVAVPIGAVEILVAVNEKVVVEFVTD